MGDNKFAMTCNLSESSKKNQSNSYKTECPVFAVTSGLLPVFTEPVINRLLRTDIGSIEYTKLDIASQPIRTKLGKTRVDRFGF